MQPTTRVPTTQPTTFLTTIPPQPTTSSLTTQPTTFLTTIPPQPTTNSPTTIQPITFLTTTASKIPQINKVVIQQHEEKPKIIKETKIGRESKIHISDIEEKKPKEIKKEIRKAKEIIREVDEKPLKKIIKRKKIII